MDQNCPPRSVCLAYWYCFFHVVCGYQWIQRLFANYPCRTWVRSYFRPGKPSSQFRPGKPRNILLTISRFANLHVNYMTIPVYITGAISLVTVVYLSDRFKRRGLCIIGCLVPVIIGYLIAVGTPNKQAGYVAMFILVLGKSCKSIYFTCPLANYVPTRNLSHFDPRRLLDSRNSSPRRQTCLWHAIRRLDRQPLQFRIVATLSHPPGPAIYPGQFGLCRVERRRGVLVRHVLAHPEDQELEEGEDEG